MKLHQYATTLLPLLAVFTISASASYAGSFRGHGPSSHGPGSPSARVSSGSFGHSSHHRPKRHRLAAGEYRLMSMQVVAGQTESVQLNLEPVKVANDADAIGGNTRVGFNLTVSKNVIHQARLITGGSIRVQHQVFGLEFVNARDDKSFHLVLAQEWQRDLDSRVVDR